MGNNQWITLPALDWDLASHLAGNQIDLAKDMLDMLVKHLPDDLDIIDKAATRDNYTELLTHVHKLHGAVSYCGTPRLKALLAHIEANLKGKNYNDMPNLLDQLHIEYDELKQELGR